MHRKKCLKIQKGSETVIGKSTENTKANKLKGQTMVKKIHRK
jgi:hypothetical protein